MDSICRRALPGLSSTAQQGHGAGAESLLGLSFQTRCCCTMRWGSTRCRCSRQKAYNRAYGIFPASQPAGSPKQLRSPSQSGFGPGLPVWQGTLKTVGRHQDSVSATSNKLACLAASEARRDTYFTDRQTLLKQGHDLNAPIRAEHPSNAKATPFWASAASLKPRSRARSSGVFPK